MPGAPLHIRLELKGLQGLHTALLQQVDRDHGSALSTWEDLGRPRFPSRAEQAQLRAAAQMPAPIVMPLKSDHDTLELDLPPYALALLELIP